MTTALRHDLYAPIHKGLRSFLLDTLLRVGRLDTTDAAEMRDTLGQLRRLLTFCEQHLQHENAFVHTALEARQPGSAARVAGEHEEHLENIAALRDDAAQLDAVPASAAPRLAQRLYGHLALFVADNFRHMHIEETLHNAALWAYYSDDELAAIHGRLMASLGADELAESARWMVPAMSPAERAGLLNGARATMPAQVFDALLVDCVRPALDATAWAKLVPAIGVAPHAGLVQFA